MPFAKPLPEAVDDLYTAFCAVPQPMTVPHCDACCVSGEVIAALLAAGRPQEVPAEVLAPYAGNLVVGTAGHCDDARYFMPRILEVVGTGQWVWPDLPAVGRFLAAADDWLPPEREVVIAYVRALWQERLATCPVPAAQPDVESILGTAAHLWGGLTAFLDYWLTQLRHLPAAEHLLGLLDVADQEEGRWRIRGWWWNGLDRQVDAWLRGSELRAEVERLHSVHPDDLTTWLLLVHLTH